MTMFTIFNTEGKWRAAGFHGDFETAKSEAKIWADIEHRTYIVKEGFIEECGAEAIFMVTASGEAWS